MILSRGLRVPVEAIFDAVSLLGLYSMLVAGTAALSQGIAPSLNWMVMPMLR